jgi:hypothetical protein
MTPRGGFCLEQRLPDNTRGITAITFAPDGRMFLALDSSLAGDVDPLILYDAYHPSRSVAVYDWVNNSTKYDEIMVESSRITGLDYADGALYLSAGGRSRAHPRRRQTTKRWPMALLSIAGSFHANNGIVISNGWLYVSAGGVRDGYVEGPIVGVGEEGAQQIVSGGNPYAARIVRAPLGNLLSQRTIAAFSTAARGVRNPYGITARPGRAHLVHRQRRHQRAGRDQRRRRSERARSRRHRRRRGRTPYYGFPLALSGAPPDWYTAPVVGLVNSAAPTGITWAYDTVYFGVYGRFPGLYRLGRAADGASRRRAHPARLADPGRGRPRPTARSGSAWATAGCTASRRGATIRNWRRATHARGR